MCRRTIDSRHVLSLVAVVGLASGCRNEEAEKQAAAARASAQAAAAATASTISAAEGNARALASAVAAETQTTVTGKLRSEGGELGTWDVVLTECRSGEVNGFYGVDFSVAGSKDVRLRYVHDEAKGAVVKIANPTKPDAMLVLDRDAKCTVLEGSLEKTDATTWTPKGKIRHLDGRVKLDCKHSAGKGRVTAEATFTHCH